MNKSSDTNSSNAALTGQSGHGDGGGADAALASIREILTGDVSRRSETDLAALTERIRLDMDALEQRLLERLEASHKRLSEGSDELRSTVKSLEQDLRAAIEQLGERATDRHELARMLASLSSELSAAPVGTTADRP